MAKKKQTALDLTLNEKVQLLYGDGNWRMRGVSSLGIDGIEMHDGPFGLVYFKGDADLSSAESVPSTCFPGPCALAATFNDELVEKVGDAVGRICRDTGTHMILAPGLNIKRNPLCGRNFEYYSEDPIVSGKLAAAYIRGVQSNGVGACMKHFACNSQESYRMTNDSIVDKRALHELYLKGFEIAVKEGHPWAAMSSYNKINGSYASDSDYLLLDVLKSQWGFDGVVMSDWGGCNDYVYSHNHGLDVEMPCFHSRKRELKRAIKNGSLSIGKVDDSVARVIRLLKRCHEMPRYKPISASDAHRLAIDAALESCVLLKNDGVLPLKSFKQTCIIGELGRTPSYQGGGSSHLTPTRVDTFLSMAENALGKDNVFFAPGYQIDGKVDEEKLAIDAVDLAARGGRVILFMGLPLGAESEGYDRENLHLPEDQISLFDQIYEVNQNIIVVLNVGAPVELPFKDKAKAIVLVYMNGEGGGEALYRILTGEVSPSGHLAETWPCRNYDVPSFGYYPGTEMVSLYRESIYVGYRYYLSANKAVNYPFGFGLSYARFKYDGPTLSTNKLGKDEEVDVTVKVENVSSIAGKAVVQLYQEPPKGSVFKPLRSLLCFKKVELAPGESKTVHFSIKYDDLSHFDIESDSFQVEGGDYLIQVCEDCQTVKGSAKLKVGSDRHFRNMHYEVPIYYNLPDDGFISYDVAFERLLGHVIPPETSRNQRPYDLNSTIGNIRNTFIGRRILAAASDMVKTDNPASRKMMQRSVEETPLRNLDMKISPRFVPVILDLANGQYFKALFHLVFRAKRVKK